jgi:pyruvate dehydrogenase E2 component (dihydrolipoamide acetyltransferase)
MPVQLTMPRLSDTMEAGTIVRWNVKEGDPVSSGDVVADVETDKATMEMPVFDDGVVAKILVDPGTQVKVGTPIAVIATDGEDVASAAASGSGPTAPARTSAPAAAPVTGASAPAPAPSATAPAAAIPATPVKAELLDDSSLRAAVQTHGAQAPAGPRVRVSPVARRMADEFGVPIEAIRGSGPGGRIVKRDIEEAMARIKSGQLAPVARTAPSAVPSTALAMPVTTVPVVPIGAQAREVAVSGMRQTIARRLVESKLSIPHYQVTMRVSMDALLELRGMLNRQLETQGVKLSVNDFIVRACAIGMQAHPFMNASWGGDRIILHSDVNVGVAVSLPAERGGGLLVATIRHADQKGLRQISLETRALAEKARTKGLSAEDMGGSTFTVSNLGMFGVEHFTAIINPPNSAILACGAAVEQPVVRNHQLAVGHEMSATLSLDHRVIDGAMAAEYLRTVRQNLENPATLMV